MFEMYKYILGKVSFDKDIFQKELKKAVSALKKEEADALIGWCRISFDEQLVKSVVGEKDKMRMFAGS
ncbi:MAG: hypothetical protein JWO44_263 [Bacteroidetes bacterium]|jgi:hypothetical protein|nr:hypothetical protein [Bacteroidota bacterium]